MELLDLYDDVMREHLRRVISKKMTDHYCSKRIQNELIYLMADQVLLDIQNRLQNEKYFSVIVDCTPDVSHSNKMSFIFRFVEEEAGSILIKEHFIGFVTFNESSGESLTDILLSTIRHNNIDFANSRGQGYGPNMKEKNKRV